MSDIASPTPEIWASYLKEGEKILWEGRPSPRIHLQRGDVSRIIFGILILPILVVMALMFINILKPEAGGAWLVIIPVGLVFSAFFAAILYTSVFHFYFAAKRRGRTRYAITNQRAMALTTGRKEKFEDGPLDENTNLDYVPGELASIFYKKIAKLKVNSQNHDSAGGRRQVTYSTRYIYQGFEFIPDGAIAYQTMLEVLGAKLADPTPAKAGAHGEAWQDFLLEGEELLWEGAPGTGPRVTKAGVILTVIGVVFIYLFGPMALYALLYGAEDAHEIVSGAFGTVMFLLGMWMAVGIWLLDIRKRKATRYALTNKRAFIASALAGRKMLTFALVPHYRPLHIKDMMDEVTFGEEDWFDKKTGEKTKRGIAFQYLKDGKEVYDILTKISIKIDEAAEAKK
ncbi:MAG TPA: hypothetical protein EYG79_06820 [Rhodobacteraceae bacterium]|nr:hypothetical protein [Paracoccaceae bacterium]